MKKYLIFIAMLLIATLTLAACSNKSLVKPETFDNYTLKISSNASDYETVLKKDGKKYSLKKSNDDETYYYAIYNSKVFKYTQKEVEFEEESGYSAISLVDTSYQPDNLENLLIALNNSDIKNGELINLENNSIIAYMVDGIILSDQTINLANAYKYNLIKCTKANVTIEKSKITKIECEFPYDSATLDVVCEFADYNSTKIADFPKETSYDKSYYDYFNESDGTKAPDAVYINVKFGDYGTVKFESLNLETNLEKNALNYFLYLYKKGFYNRASIDSSTANIVMIGDQKEPISKQIVAKQVLANTPSNKRGTLAIRYLDDNSDPTQQFQINLTDLSSSYDTKSTVIAGVIDGFDVLDEISQLSTNQYSSIKIKISVEYNNYKYTEPTFK